MNMTDTLYPSDRVAPQRTERDVAALCARARILIDAAVPNGGLARTFLELIAVVRSDAQCCALFPDEILPIILEAKAARPRESQLPYADPIDEGTIGE